MSLSIIKLNDDDIPIAFNTNSNTRIFYNQVESDDESEGSVVSLTLSERDEIENMLNEYPTIKYKRPHIKKYISIKKQVNDERISKIKGGPFFPCIQNMPEQIMHLHINGKQGCGKSYFAGKFVKHYIETFPENKIYLFSLKPVDKAYDVYPQIKRIKIDEDILDTELKPETLSNMLFIFDDIERIENDKVRKKVYGIINSVSELGRASNIYIISINHQPLGGSKTKIVNNEMTAVVIFPKLGNKHHNRSILKKYAGMNDNFIDKVINKKIRWACINISVPSVLITQRRIELI